MRIAVTYDNGMVYQHYSRSPYIKIYDVTPGVITNTQLVQARGFLRKYNVNDILKDYDVDVLVTGRIGIAARLVVSAAGIRIRDGHAGNADYVVAEMIGMHIAPPRPEPHPNIPKRTLTAPRAQQRARYQHHTVMQQPAPKPAPMPRRAPAPKRSPVGKAPQMPPQSPPHRTQPPKPQQGNSRGGGFRK